MNQKIRRIPRKLLGAAVFAAALLLTGTMRMTAYAEESGKIWNTAESDTVKWHYDAASKVVTITGEGYRSKGQIIKDEMPKETEIVVFENCKISGSLKYLFGSSDDMVRFPNLKKVDFSGLDASGVEDMSYMFMNCRKLESIDLSGLNTAALTNLNGLFYGCNSLSSVNLSNMNTSKVKDMSDMFSFCNKLTSLDVSGFDTSSAEKMRGMFENCSAITAIDISGFKTAKVKDMSNMFAYCSSLKQIDVTSLNTENVTNMSGMFAGCGSITALDITSLNMSNVTTISNMFQSCVHMEKLDLSGLDWSKAQLGKETFASCDSLVEIKVPAKINSGLSLDLPGEFKNNKGVKTKKMTLAFVNMVLSREKPTNAVTDNTVVEVDVEEYNQIRDFVTRMYTVVLQRQADRVGLLDWINKLTTGENDGAGIAYGFIMSVEFQKRNLSNEDFVDTMYKTFFNRDADAAGKEYWLQALSEEKSRGYVLSGFVNSVEFDELCGKFGIARGTMREDGTAVNPGIRQFVERCYKKVLGRDGEKAGVDDWTNRIITGIMTPKDVAKTFFFADEYVKKNVKAEEYIETLYSTFLNRKSDTKGKADWLGKLNNNIYTKEEVLDGFADSPEFTSIMQQYGL